MKQVWIKALMGKLAATASMLLFLVLVPAAAAGSLPVWAAVLLGALGIMILNTACGVLLSEEKKEEAQQPTTVRPVQLRVVRGGRAA